MNRRREANFGGSLHVLVVDRRGHLYGILLEKHTCGFNPVLELKPEVKTIDSLLVDWRRHHDERHYVDTALS